MSSLYQKVESLFTAKILNVFQSVDAANHLIVGDSAGMGCPHLAVKYG